MTSTTTADLNGIFDELVHLGDELADIARAQQSRQAARLATTVVNITGEVAEVRERLSALVGIGEGERP